MPVLHSQGEQHKFVPFGHRVWLSRRVPDVGSRLSAKDGHLTQAVPAGVGSTEPEQVSSTSLSWLGRAPVD
jgi:hypothetical protein